MNIAREEEAANHPMGYYQVEKQMEKARKDLRRERMYAVSEENILQVFNAWMGLPGYVQIPTVPGIPEGARFTGAWYNPSRRAWDLRVWHESFDVVPDGEQIPSVFDRLDVYWKTIKLNKPEEVT